MIGGGWYTTHYPIDNVLNYQLLAFMPKPKVKFTDEDIKLLKSFNISGD
jgi:hypothetical protein